MRKRDYESPALTAELQARGQLGWSLLYSLSLAQPFHRCQSMYSGNKIPRQVL